MKIKLLILAVCLCTTAFAEQFVLVVPCRDGAASTQELSRFLKEGWRVVVATPIQDSDSMALGKPKQGYTKSIVYILDNK